jgi:hypothetical protein
MKLEFFQSILKNIQISDFPNIGTVGTVFFHADGRSFFPRFANVPKNAMSQSNKVLSGQNYMKYFAKKYIAVIMASTPAS